MRDFSSLVYPIECFRQPKPHLHYCCAKLLLMQNDKLFDVTLRPTGTSFVTMTHTADLGRGLLHTGINLQEKLLSEIDCNKQ